MKLKTLKMKLSDANVFSFEQMSTMTESYLKACYNFLTQSVKHCRLTGGAK